MRTEQRMYNAIYISVYKEAGMKIVHCIIHAVKPVVQPLDELCI